MVLTESRGVLIWNFPLKLFQMTFRDKNSRAISVAKMRDRELIQSHSWQWLLRAKVFL